MGFKTEMTNEELEQIAGGHLSDIPGLEAIGPYAAAGGVTPNLIVKEFPGIPIPGDPGNGEDAQFVPI